MRYHLKTLLALVIIASLALAGCGGGGGSGAPVAPGVSSPAGITATPIDDGNPATPIAVFAIPAAINDNNQIVGAAEASAGGTLQPAFWQVDDEGVATIAATAMATLVPGGFAAGHDLNGSGVIVGKATGADTSTRAVMWADMDAAPTALQGLAPLAFASAYGINDSGRIVGTAENGTGLYKAVYWQRAANGTLTGPFELPGVPDAWEAEAYKINADNTIAGELIDTEGISRAAIWRLEVGVYVRLDLPTPTGFDHALGIDLNSPAAGEPLVVVGEAADDGLGGLSHAVRWAINGATVTAADLGINNRASSAAAVNTAGRAAGWENDAAAVGMATVWNSPTGKTTLLDSASQAFDISDNDLVVGRSGSQGFVKRVN